MRTTTLLAVALVAFGGCRKKYARQYYELESRATILEVRDGEGGLLSEEMAQIILGLKAVPADTEEGPKAAALVARLESERREAQARRDAAEAAVQQAAEPTTATASFGPSEAIAQLGGAAADASVAEPDAGPSMPWANMSLEEFQSRFGACMESAGERQLAGGGTGSGWEVIHTPTCSVKYQIPGEETRRFFLFRDGRLVQEQTEERRLVRADAGRPPPPAPPVSPYVMGMPVPGAGVPDAQ